MRIRLVSVPVDQQDKALTFYTSVLGFQKKQDVSVGEFRWLTVVSPEEPDAAQLVLEPDANPASKAYKRALVEQSIPIAAFEVADLQKEVQRLKRKGVRFVQEPMQAGPVVQATLDDTCGNLIQLYQVVGPA